MFFCFPLIVSGQVGIGTENPLGIFHVDSKNNNPKTGSPTEEQAADDVVVLENGNMGVGLIDPDRKLTINSGEDHVSGLRFTQLNSNSPKYNGKSTLLGIDESGNVIPIRNSDCIPEYYFAIASNSSSSNLSENGRIDGFTHSVESNGITQNTGIPSSNRGFNLKKGKLYKLTAALYYTAHNNNAKEPHYFSYEWRADGERIEDQNISRSANSATTGGSQTMAIAFFRPEEDIIATLVISYVSRSSLRFWGNHSYILIEQIDSCEDY